MSWEGAFAGERDQAARGPMPAAPATLGEIWRAGWQAAGLDTAFGLADPWREAQAELRSAIEGAAGLPAAELARAQGRSLRSIDWAGASWQDQARELAELSSGLTPEQQEKVKPFLDVPTRARQLAAERERQAADVADRTYGLGGHAVGFLAGVTRAAVDPINLATMFVGGPLRGPVLRMLAREAGLGAAVQAVQEPLIQSGRAELGLEAGLSRALTSIAEAGIGNAGLAGLFRGAGWLMRQGALPADAPAARPADAAAASPLVERLNAEALPAAGEALPSVPPGLRDLDIEDLDAAARLAERDELIDTLSPDRSSAGRAGHAEAVETILARMESAGEDGLARIDGVLAELAARQAELDPPDAAAPPRPARPRRPKEPKPVSLGRFIAMNGGLRIDAGGDVRHLAINRMFVPGHGMVGRINGRQLDRDLEPLLIAEGYLRPHDPDMPSRDISEEVFDALEQEFKMNRPLYAIGDAGRLGDQRSRAEISRDRDQDQRWRDELEAEVAGLRRQMAEVGYRPEDLGDDEMTEIADRLLRGIDGDWETAMERVVMARELAHDASPTALAAAEDFPDWEIADAIFGRDAQQDRGRAGGEGGEGAGSAGEGGSGAARAELPQPGQDGAAAGGRRGDQALAETDGLAGLAAELDDPALFKARLADLQRHFDEAGGDIRLELDTGPVSARALIAEIRADADAAEALKACLGQGGGGAP